MLCGNILYKHDGASASGIQYELYFAAKVGGNGKCTLVDEFQSYPTNDLNSEAWKTLAEALSAYVRLDRLTPVDGGATDAQGSLRFPAQQSSLKSGTPKKPSKPPMP